MKPVHQGKTLLARLRRPHTYMQMLSYQISVSPWKRVLEALRQRPDLKLVKGKTKAGLVTWSVTKA